MSAMLNRVSDLLTAPQSQDVGQARNGTSLALRGLSKSYGPVTAVNDVSLEIESGEFMALLGASGSGKSTILMMIAGFETPTAGEILLDQRNIISLPPHRRDIGMVFQRYALFPHMTVAENIAYPLRRRGADRTTIEAEVARTLRMVSLDGFGSRYPAQLSGGQQQRVALARALVFRPRVLLMDESLGALDRKLRQQMQMEIKLLHRALGTTIVFVTHDQEEALSMADRVAVLSDGQLMQVGTPADLYRAPQSALVAGFIGETNFLPVERVHKTSDSMEVQCLGATLAVPKANCCADDNNVVVGVRPEHVQLIDHGAGIRVSVVETVYRGSTLTVLLQAQGCRLTASLPAETHCPSVGETVGMTFAPENCRLYAK
jgi:putative spermidine/putrescine transport system ATP-binding protein